MATSSKDFGYVDNWQAGQTVIECNLHMLTSEDFSDVTFRIGSEKHVVPAHRYILVSRSCVFHAMFCGPLAEKGEVTIPDIEDIVFREFLRYLYTDTVNLTADNVTGLLYTARKYAVDALQEMCVSFLEKLLSEYTVCQILEQCHGYGETNLEQKALNILSEAGMNVIQSPGFLDLCSHCLEKFLKSEDLNLKEEEVFEGVVSWTKAACKKEGISPTPGNLKKVLGHMRYEIRFTEFPLEYMVNVVGQSGVLDDSERMRIVDKIVNNNVDISPFNSGPREKKVEHLPQLESPTYVCRFDWSYDIHIDAMSCLRQPEAVSFKTSKNISLVGCQLYGPSGSTCNLSILLHDDQDQMIAQSLHNTTRRLRGRGHYCNVKFPYPVALVAGRSYIFCVTMSGEDSKGSKGHSSVTVDKVTFTFSNSKSSTSTTVIVGKMPGLIWR